MKQLFWSVCLLGRGVFFLCRILQGNNLYLKITKADKNNFFFNLNYPEGRQHTACSSHSQHCEKASLRLIVLTDNPEHYLLKSMPIKKFQLRGTEKFPAFSLSYTLTWNISFKQTHKVYSPRPQILLPSITALICLKIGKKWPMNFRTDEDELACYIREVLL